jgi:hypothetical protein
MTTMEGHMRYLATSPRRPDAPLQPVYSIAGDAALDSAS